MRVAFTTTSPETSPAATVSVSLATMTRKAVGFVRTAGAPGGVNPATSRSVMANAGSRAWCMLSTGSASLLEVDASRGYLGGPRPRRHVARARLALGDIRLQRSL